MHMPLYWWAMMLKLLYTDLIKLRHVMSLGWLYYIYLCPCPALYRFYFITPHHLFFIIIAHLRINSNQFSIILNEISSSFPYLVTKRCAPGSKKCVIYECTWSSDTNEKGKKMWLCWWSSLKSSKTMIPLCWWRK